MREITQTEIDMSRFDNLMNEMVCLSEVRGELDPVSNAKIEAKLAEIGEELKAIDEARVELEEHAMNFEV